MADSTDLQPQRPRGVDVLLSEQVDPPYCPHGPTVLFERFFEKKASRRFFACSACRDRKQCSFFWWADQIITPEKRSFFHDLFVARQPQINRPQLMERYKKFKNLKKEKRKYCATCNLLLFVEEWEDHESHDVVGMVTAALAHPSELLVPYTDKKTYAQFFFTEKTTQFLVTELKRQGFTHVISVGTPRIHESINADLSTNMKSFLLDLDYRYSAFYREDQFQQFNLLNGFFFDEDKGKGRLTGFLGNTDRRKVIVLADAPFGALATLVGRGIQSLWRDCLAGERTDGPVTEDGDIGFTILIFPYFLEKHVNEKDALPSLRMMDYQVTYECHRLYKDKKNYPSAARFYTNLPPPGLRLPKEEGYWYCKTCVRYVSKENKHCAICNVCTSKDGRSYEHCDMCKVCVKSGRVHCLECESCQPPNHKCQPKQSTNCHICGEFGHKRRDCPNKEKGKTLSITRKRKTLDAKDVTMTTKRTKLIKRTRKT